ncbi:phasin family protein [Xanthobacter sediminis]
MTTETSAPKAETTFFTSSASFPGTDWLKGWGEAPAKAYAAAWGKVLDLAAGSLEEQAAHLRQLSRCTDPAEALRLNATFAQQSIQRLWSDSAKAFQDVRSGFPPIGTGK